MDESSEESENQDADLLMGHYGDEDEEMEEMGEDDMYDTYVEDGLLPFELEAEEGEEEMDDEEGEEEDEEESLESEEIQRAIKGESKAAAKKEAKTKKKMRA